MQINLSRISSNLKASVREELSGQKAWWLHGAPYMIGATICFGLSKEVFLQPSEKVLWVTSKVLDAAVLGLTIKGAHAFVKALDNENATLQGRKIEMAQLPKEELESMKKEISRLKQEISEANRKLNPEPRQNQPIAILAVPEPKRISESNLSEIHPKSTKDGEGVTNLIRSSYTILRALMVSIFNLLDQIFKSIFA